MAATLEQWGLRWVWITLYLLVGIGLELASRLANVRPRGALLLASAALWLWLAGISGYLRMPIATFFAGVLVFWSLRRARRLTGWW